MTLEMSARNTRRLLETLRRAYPEAGELEIAELREITEGWETTILSVRLDYRGDAQWRSQDMILRFFHGAEQSERAQREFGLMRRLHELGMPVPRAELAVGADSPLGEAFIMMERVAGQNLLDHLQGASEAQVESAIDSMVLPFVQLHRLPWRKVFSGDMLATEPDPEQGFAAARLDSLRRTVERVGLDEFEPLTAWLEERAELGAPARPSVLHNDYHPRNLLVREADGSLVVIDWSFAQVGDYRMDLAWCLLQTEVMLGRRYRDAMLQAYEAAAGAPVVHLEFFEALKFAERMATIILWLSPSVEIQVKKITREAIRGDYKVHVINVYRRLKEITGIRLATIEAL